MPKTIGDSSVKVAVIDCFQSCSFPSLSIKEGFGFGPFVGILIEFKRNEQDEIDLWCRPNFLEVDFVFYNSFKLFEILRQNFKALKFKELFNTNMIHFFFNLNLN